MEGIRQAGSVAVKFEVVISGRPAMLTLDGTRFRYEREGVNPIENEFSVVALESGAFTVLIEGRSYEAIVIGEEVRVNARFFSVEVFDPRAMRARKASGGGAGPQNIVATMP